MFSKKGMLFITPLALLVFVGHASVGSNANDDRTTTHAISFNANNDNANPSPDFDGDGTVGFPDFLLFAAQFGFSQGDAGYDARYDLDGDGTIGFGDFLIFANNFGKEVEEILVPQIYNDKVFVLPVEENLAALWTESGNSPPLQDYAARFYEHFNDEFDFLIFFANVDRTDELAPGAYDGSFYNHVKNDVQGIGLSTFSNNSNWGSAGKLQGVIFFSIYEPYHPIFEYSDFRQGILLHELMHRWANFIIPNTSNPSHWGLSSPGGVLGDDISNMINLGDGKFSAINIRRVQFSPIELYLAGFIPPEDVPDFQIAEDAEWLTTEIVEDDKGLIANFIFTASGIKTYTTEDIIAEHGPRVPDHLQAQKDFRAAVILLISEDYPAPPEILENVSDDVSWFSHVGEDELEKQNWPLSNFYEATGGRGTITMDGLSQFQSRSLVKKLVPSSFGTPPQPIVDYWE